MAAWVAIFFHFFSIVEMLDALEAGKIAYNSGWLTGILYTYVQNRIPCPILPFQHVMMLPHEIPYIYCNIRLAVECRSASFVG